MTLQRLVDRFEGAERSVVVVNRTDPDPVHDMLVDTLSDDHVRVVGQTARDEGSADPSADDWVKTRSTADPATDGTEYAVDVETLRRNDAVSFDGDEAADVENLVLLLNDDEVIAGSTLDELGEAVLFVNSDLYITGGRGLDGIELPSVITRLDDTVFTLRGYPESNRQKLLLITISRFIERVAYRAGAGTLRSSFQRLSRLRDELGTRRVYERVADAGVDAHLYGVPDDPPEGLDATIHGGRSVDFTNSWFVVYEPPAGPSRAPEAGSDLERGIRGGVGLLAVETKPRVWRGIWTFDPGRLSAVGRYVSGRL